MSEPRTRIIETITARAGDLAPHPHQWKAHPKKQLDGLRAMLAGVGIVDHLLAYRSERAGGALVLIDGHGRQEIDPDQVWPVAVLDLTDQEADLVLATLDPLVAMAQTERAKLLELLARTRSEDERTRDLLQAVAQQAHAPRDVSADNRTQGAELRALIDKWKTAAGQVWEAASLSIPGGGVQRVGCGDSRDPEMVARVMGGEKPALLIADPPYCSGGYQEVQRSAGTWGDIAGDNLSTRGFQALITAALTAARPDAAYLFTDWRMWLSLWDLVEASSLAVRMMLVWDKDDLGIGGLWRTQTELVMFATRAANTREAGVPGLPNVIRCKRTGNKWHYTEKPVAVMRHILEGDAASPRGRCPFLDPFMGAGSSILAAEAVGREGRGLDVEPLWLAVALERLSLAGLQPVKVTG